MVVALAGALRQSIEQAGYHPGLVASALSDAVAQEQVIAHVVHQETTFDDQAVRRHITVLVLTPTRLVMAHADEQETTDGPGVTVTTEAVPLSRIGSVVMSKTYAPQGQVIDAVLTIGWGAVSRVDLAPAQCADENCTADHGYQGTVSTDDVQLRVASAAEGAPALAELLNFGVALSSATSR